MASDIDALHNRRHGGAMTDEFYRIQRLPPYVFAEVNAMKAAARARGDASSKLVMHVAGDMPEAWLINDLGAKYKLLEENTMGRSKEVEISIQSDSVSRRHAEVFANAGDFWVADMGSTNATEVNGRRLGSAPHKLVPGDVIRVGAINFRYEEKRRPVE